MFPFSVNIRKDDSFSDKAHHDLLLLCVCHHQRNTINNIIYPPITVKNTLRHLFAEHDRILVLQREMSNI